MALGVGVLVGLLPFGGDLLPAVAWTVVSVGGYALIIQPPGAQSFGIGLSALVLALAIVALLVALSLTS